MGERERGFGEATIETDQRERRVVEPEYVVAERERAVDGQVMEADGSEVEEVDGREMGIDEHREAAEEAEATTMASSEVASRPLLL